MSRPDSERALSIYKTFTTQTEEVVQFLGVARHFQSATRLEIPKLKHASTDLARLLEDDLNDPDFDLRRREYLAGKGIKKAGRAPTSGAGSGFAEASSNDKSQPVSNPPKQPETQKQAPTDLIDFFDSIEQNQQSMAQPGGMPYQQTGFQQQQPQQAFYPQQAGFPQQPQATGYGQQNQYGQAFPQQNTGNPFGQQQIQSQPQPQPQPLQSMPTGAGFGGYTAQPQSYGFQSQLGPIPQNAVPSFSQQPQQPQQPQALQPQHTGTNPFRQSMLLNNPTGGAQPAPAAPLQRQNTNPFAKRLSMAQPNFNQGAAEPVPQVPQVPQIPQAQAQPQALQPQRTGTNPFARSSPVPPQNGGLQPPAAAPLQPNPTGSTNPFRQSQFINQQTGQGWQTGQNGTMGGLEQMETVPIFPRPGMA